MSTLIFFVNGKKIEDPKPDPEWSLLYYLRTKLDLCGTKLGCGEGGCGACTVMVSKYDHQNNKIIHLAVNACLAPVCSMHGFAVTTVEGIGSTKTRLHPVQERIAKAHGSQCGFCTPGIVMSMYALLRSMPKPSYSDLEVAFQGNLCRCTGYRPILEGFKTFTEEWETNRVLQNGNGVCSKGDQCCRAKGKASDGDTPEDTFTSENFTPYDPSQEPIFPPELKLSSKYDQENLKFAGKNVIWYRPTSLEQLLELKSNNKDAKIVIGNTEVGVEVKFKNFVYPVIIMPKQVKELNAISVTEKGITLGAAVTLTDMENTMKSLIESFPLYKTKIFVSIVEMLHWFAGKQIRNVAAVGGNIMTGSPISDLNPIFMAARAELHLKSTKGDRKVVMDENFFTSYRKNIVLPDEILISISIPYTQENQYFKSYKQAKRRDDDIAIVNMALNVELDKTAKITDILLSYGGMGPMTIIAKKTCQNLIGEFWNHDMVQKAYSTLLDEIKLDPSAPGGMIRYRQSLTLSLFFKSFIEILNEISVESPNVPKLSDREKSAIGGFEHRTLKSSQYFNIRLNDQSSVDPVGKPIIHFTALQQASGEAMYCDDMPLLKGELYLSLVISTKSHAKLIGINPSKALSMEGVHCFFSSKDIDDELNHVGPIVQDEEVFISNTITSQGQVLGAIVAIDQDTARKAAKAVIVTYEELQPIITIEDAIKNKSFFPGFPKVIERGNVEQAFKEADFIVENELRVGGQEHFYLETHAARAIPNKENNEIEIYYSGQHPSEISNGVSKLLKIPINQVVTKVKRIGGGFGGKETRAVILALPVALAAHRLQKPVRCMYDRDEDMQITGNRHPFYFKYKIAFNKDGKIVGAIIDVYSNGGYSLDLSASVLTRAMLHCENTYYIPNIKVVGYVCKTNLPSNTAFRGFGGPQSMLLAENYIRDVALKLNKDSTEIAYTNLYQEGQYTHYQQALINCTLKKCFNQCISKSNYYNKKTEVDEFNKMNQWKKRGISVVTTKFGISFEIGHLNQAGALVHIYTDGSVLISHGGVEMGQGLHTKMIQVASKALNIDQSKIFISESATDKVPNASPTAGSASSDLNGMAVLNACTILNDRLKPFKEKFKDGTWENWILEAYLNCTSLSAVGFYTLPGIGYNIDTNSGTPYNYFTYGAACSIVEIDCLTGYHDVIQTDIVMDIGESLNPAIDIGQIEGAFTQGHGLFTMEELIYSPTGELYSKGPGTYKIPAFSDIPKTFNVSLLKGATNPRAIYSSKGIGEPPLFLAASIFFAIKNAITAYRIENNAESSFKLNSPATVERIRMACHDNITSMLEEQKENGTWNVIP